MTFADIRGRRAPPVSGVLNPRAALSLLIRGQGLEARYVAGGYVLSAARQRPPSPPPPAPSEPPIELDAVVVTGFRGGLQQAQDIKRQALGSQDVIVAEDIAAFPDLNLAESLQRIPGLTISRDAGEGRQIALRGLGPDFTRAQLNGMEVSASTSSGFDNRGSVSRTRAFDYSIFASELFSRVTVFKTYSADQDEGGIGGAVELRTAKPQDYPGARLALSVKGLTNSVTQAVTPRVAALASNRWGDLGALVSVAYSENDINEYGYRNWGWTPVTFGAANIGAGVSAADRDRLINATGANRVMAPQAQTWSTWLDHRKRLGITTSLQYTPQGRFSAGLDLLYGKLSNARDEYALANAGQNPLTGNVIGTQRLEHAVIEGGSLVQASFTGVDLRSEHKRSIDATQFGQGVLNASYRLGERSILKAMTGYSRSDFDEPVFDKIFLQSRGQAVAYDFRGPGRPGVNTYGFDPADAAAWSLMRGDTREDSIVNSFATTKIDLEHENDGGWSWRVGVQHKLFRNDGWQRHDRVDYDGATTADAVIKQLVTARSLGVYVVGDVEQTLARLSQRRDLTAADDQPGSDYALRERTIAAYAQGRWVGAVFGLRLRADAGVRYYATDLLSKGMVDTGKSLKPASIAHDYRGLLPAANLAFDLRSDLVLRLAANRNISRPSLSDLRAAGNVNANPFGGTISSGNPNLRPFLADSVEASLELYRGADGYAAISVFHKTMDSFITLETSAVTYGSTGYPLEFLSPGQTAASIYNYNRPVNGDGASISGVELAVRKDFDFLPAPFNRLGFVGNVTHAMGKSDVIIENRPVALDLLQLSRWSSNATLYYETERWGARISSAYRDGYLDSAGGNGNVGGGYHAVHNIDAALHYELSPKLKLVAEAVNLTDQAIDQYTDIAADRLIARTKSGRTFTFGLTYEF
ncbi:TonB-dependent receptor [Caulobacter sp. NIBR2454]|uniref:TonB-dependent receptor n=1 Tax=Caulobacter sp. NIBR2454 TaxID=3015996 RepID=UPI0022B6B099|nr:TonB-dependent receptor [Caulobacter sp. NIBR2454]